MENLLVHQLKSSSIVSLGELQGDIEDKSLERHGDIIRLQRCEDQTFIANAYRHCSRCLQGAWEKCPLDKFSVNYLSGGLTNYLYLCEIPADMPHKEHEPCKVLIRIHGDIIDQKQRFYEGVIFTLLSERGYGPKMFGVFNSGRIEEYIPFPNLQTRQLADLDISLMIACKTAEYHCMNLPLNKEPTFLWENFDKYLGICATVSFDDEESQQILVDMKGKMNVLEEYTWLRDMLKDLKSPVVFCHNDLQEGNILYMDRGDRDTDVKLIDYDYSSFNYRGFDIGNHFCEWMFEYRDHHENGFTVYHDSYPSEKQQRLFAMEYIRVTEEIKKQLNSGALDNHKYNVNIQVCTVETLLHEANRFALASHLFWFLWSIVQARLSKIDFGYLKYANARMDAYLSQKKELGYK